MYGHTVAVSRGKGISKLEYTNENGQTGPPITLGTSVSCCATNAAKNTRVTTPTPTQGLKE